MLESMELVQLSSPPHILTKTLEVCQDPNSSTVDLANLMATDAALTSKLLMALNTAPFACDEPVSNLGQVISFLGHELVRSMLITSVLQQFFSGLSQGSNEFACNIWLESLYSATFAEEIALHLNYESPHDAYLAGLLHDIGKVVLAARFHDQYIDILDLDSEQEIIQREFDKFGTSHTDLGANLLGQWSNMSPVIADATRFHHEPREKLKESDILCQINAEAGQLASHWSRFGAAQSGWRSSLVNDVVLNKIYLQVNDRMIQHANMLEIPCPESGGLIRQQLLAELENDNVRLAQRVRDVAIAGVNNSSTHSSKLDSPRNLLVKIAREMQLIFSISKMVLLFPGSPDNAYLSLYEIGPFTPSSKFNTAGNNSLAIKSFVDKLNLWIEPGQSTALDSSLTDCQIINRLKCDKALSLPLICTNKVIATLIIGVQHSRNEFSPAQLNSVSVYLKGVAALWVEKNRMVSPTAASAPPQKLVEQKELDMLVHEISNPLSVIGNYIDIIKRNSIPGGSDDSAEIRVLKEELSRVREIVSRFSEQKTQYRTGSSIFLNAELELCLPVYVESLSQDKKVRLHWSLDKIDPEVNITRDAFRQILLNLVKNAVEAQSDEVKIAITSHHFVNIDGKIYAQFCITDRGGGVDASIRQLLFSPVTSTKGNGNRGLGLALVTDILGGFNGRIKYMENIYGGASFEVLLPLSK